MARTLTIENDTHWKTSDVLRIVRGAIAQAEADTKRRRHVKVRWQNQGSRVSYRITGAIRGSDLTNIEIFLPRKGPKKLHSNALIALAAAGIESDTPMLAVSDSYFLANAFAFELAKERCHLAGAGRHADQEERTRAENKVDELRSEKRSTAPPSWADAEALIIAKYADPLKDGTFVALKEKKEAEIASAQQRIDKWKSELARATRNLKRAEKDKKKAETALAAAKKRRTNPS